MTSKDIKIKNIFHIKFLKFNTKDIFNGGWYRIRTYDPLLVRQMLSPTELITQIILSSNKNNYNL